MNTWTGELGDFWSGHAAEYERLMARHARLLVDAAVITDSDRVLDVGCGTGPTTRLAAERAASVVGLDVSPAMVQVARSRTTQPHVTYQVADAQTAALPRVDVVISQYGVMFFEDPDAAFGNLHHALERGGRLAFLCWRAVEADEGRTLTRAVATRYTEVPPRRPAGAPGAFSMADPGVVRRLLEGAGFADVALSEVDVPLTWGTTVEEALDFVMKDELGWIDPASEVHAAVERDVRAELTARDHDGEVRLGSAAWLVTATA